MRYFPDEDSGIYPLLFQADKALGDPSAAAKAVRFGLRLFPDNSELQRLKLLLVGQVQPSGLVSSGDLMNCLLAISSA